MALNRYVTEMGMGADVHGRDYTKAAKRAVSDAIRHSSLNFFRALGKSPNDMKITVRIGVAQPDQVDTKPLQQSYPTAVLPLNAWSAVWMFQLTAASPKKRPWAMPSLWQMPPSSFALRSKPEFKAHQEFSNT